MATGAPYTYSLKVLGAQAVRALTHAGLRAVTISWATAVPGVSDITSFNLYRGGSPDSLSLLVSGITVNFYQDTRSFLHYAAGYYYKVTYMSTARGESSTDDADLVDVYTIPPAGFGGELNRVLVETTRRVNWAFAGIGEPVELFLRKRVGVLCPVCYDPVADKVTDERCPVCFGTGYVGGFDKFTGRAFINMNERRLAESEFGYSVNYQPRGALGSYPLIQENDILVRSDGRRFLVTGVTTYVVQNFVVEHEFGLTEAIRGSVAYLLQ
jgi:hypothetical protein